MNAIDLIKPLPPSSFIPLPVMFPKIDRHPSPANWGRGVLSSLPPFDPKSKDPFQVDLRSYNLSQLDLRNTSDELAWATFDTCTKWPPAQQMDPLFQPDVILDVGKNPGLEVRLLHQKGMTGHDVGIGIVDQPLLVDHLEYKGQLRLYEEINVDPNMEAQMHGPAVASIAIGQTVGVAPEADLYYIGAWAGDWGPAPGQFTYNFTYYAQAVRRLLAIDQLLPKGRKIRVIAMAVGWDPSQAGYAEITAAVNDAKNAGILVVSSSIEQTFGFKFHGMGRLPMASPDAFSSYGPGAWWEDNFYQDPINQIAGRLLVPMDSRTTASPTGVKDYAFYRIGGWSWSIPYIAGMYALAAQVKPKITPDTFWKVVLKTGKTIELIHNRQKYKFGPILYPVLVILYLQDYRCYLRNRHYFLP
jgi:Subtilase family